MHQEFFSPLAFDFLWESMELGELPYPLRVRSHGATEDERVSLRHRVDTELKARGIRDARGRVEPDVEDWLTLLARAPHSIDALHIPQFEAHPVALLAAGDERTGVVAIQDADGIWLRAIPADGLVSTIVELLPGGPRGSEASVTLPLDEALHTQPIRVPVAAGGGQPEEKGGRMGEAAVAQRTRHGRSARDLRAHRGPAAAARRSARSEQPVLAGTPAAVPGARLVRHRHRTVFELVEGGFGRPGMGHRRPGGPGDAAEQAG